MVQDNTDKAGHIVVAIAGYARTGKDTIADAIFNLSENRNPEYCVLITKFADALKQSVQEALEEVGLEVDAFTENALSFIDSVRYCRWPDAPPNAVRLFPRSEPPGSWSHIGNTFCKSADWLSTPPTPTRGGRISSCCLDSENNRCGSGL
jgi:hypothetical protein